MPFEIDTGTQERRRAVDFAPDWLVDQMPPAATEAQIVKAAAEALVGELAAYKTKTGARDKLGKAWWFLQALREEYPDQFDWILTEYTEAIFALR